MGVAGGAASPLTADSVSDGVTVALASVDGGGLLAAVTLATGAALLLLATTVVIMVATPVAATLLVVPVGPVSALAGVACAGPALVGSVAVAGAAPSPVSGTDGPPLVMPRELVPGSAAGTAV